MSESVHCPKCLSSMTGDVIGQPCRVTPGCTGIIERQPTFAELTNPQPDTFMCPRRSEAPYQITPGPDHWDKFKSNGQRVCSYCGSLHFEDFYALVLKAAEAPLDAEYREVVEIEPTDKKYKVYVNQPGVRNAYEGGIKFYTMHLPRDPDGKIVVTDEQNQHYGEAVFRSNARFERMMSMIRARPQTELKR